MVVVGCGSSGPAAGAATLPGPIASTDTRLLEARLAAIDAAVKRWQAALDLATARRSAEEARNLIVGRHGPSYGDADRNGTVEGASATGLLPGLGGEDGLATTAAGPCVERDVLGGSWADPAARWSTLETVIGAWSPSNNTFPVLPSHPQRLVGWATIHWRQPTSRPPSSTAGTPVSTSTMRCGPSAAAPDRASSPVEPRPSLR